MKCRSGTVSPGSLSSNTRTWISSKGLWTAGVLICLTLATGCSDGNDNGAGSIQPSPLDNQLHGLIDSLGMTGDPRPENIPKITDPLAQLGMKLFFSKSLSGEFDTACASCHHPMLGGGDQLSLPVGTGALDPDLLGPGRAHISGMPLVGRNTPTTFNSALYKSSIFLDGRVEKVEGVGIISPDSASPSTADPQAGADLLSTQARFPVVTAPEMRSENFEPGADNETVRAHLAARIGDYGVGAGEIANNHWVEEFEKVFGTGMPREELVTFANITLAISAYQQSQSFVNSPWKAYVEGDYAAISDEAKLGAIQFLTKPPAAGIDSVGLGAGCVKCHSGDFFSSEKFEVVSMPQIGPGKGDPHDDDLGRDRVVKGTGLLYQFRVSSLLNIEVTAPYGHAGAYGTLEETVEHYSETGQFVKDYANSQGWCQLQQFSEMGSCASLFPNALVNANLSLGPIAVQRFLGLGEGMLDILLNDEEVHQLVAFMKTLTDPCVLDADCLAPWVPDPNDAPDGHQLIGHTREGGVL